MVLHITKKSPMIVEDADHIVEPPYDVQKGRKNSRCSQ